MVINRRCDHPRRRKGTELTQSTNQIKQTSTPRVTWGGAFSKMDCPLKMVKRKSGLNAFLYEMKPLKNG